MYLYFTVGFVSALVTSARTPSWPTAGPTPVGYYPELTSPETTPPGPTAGQTAGPTPVGFVSELVTTGPTSQW